MAKILAYWKNRNDANGSRAFIGTVVSFKGDEVKILTGSKDQVDIIVMPLIEVYLTDIPEDSDVVVEIFDNNTKCWRRTEMRLVREDNIFRMYAPDGSRKYDGQGNNVFVAFSDAYKNPDGIWQVSTIY